MQRQEQQVQQNGQNGSAVYGGFGGYGMHGLLGMGTGKMGGMALTARKCGLSGSSTGPACPMEMTRGSESKKARWSPNLFTNSPVANGTFRGLFANYGYGGQAAINHHHQQAQQQQQQAHHAGFGAMNGTSS
ncbi:hypothetical protein DFH11DRAFT_1732817 [Phellopilus nigrolimitatus]|nr:hypothetical protein DFH11DRAFT_1732817 [Phellopilus nigrolimitatus]